MPSSSEKENDDRHLAIAIFYAPEVPGKNADYLPLTGREPEDFYEVIGERYERGSILVTSNRDYAEWPEAFGENPLLASAALDRLAHRAHLITITGASFRAHYRPRPLGKDPAMGDDDRPTVQ